MSLTELRSFHAVARMGSFSKAAQDLLRSQPTITIQVAQLEKRYRTELFQRRRGQKLEITDFGKQLFEITRRLFALEADALDLLENSEDLQSGHIKIGASFPNLPTKYILPFREKYPNIEVSLMLGNSSDVLRDLRDCKVDIGFLGGNGDYRGCNALHLAELEIVMIAHKNHSCVQSGFIYAKDLCDETLLLREQGSETRELLLNKLNAEGFLPGTTIEISSREGVCAAAAAGLGLGIIALDEIIDGYDLGVVRIKGFQIFGQAHAISLKERGYTKLISAFLGMVEGVKRQ